MRLIILLCLISLTSFGQTIKQHSIYNGQGIILTRFISYEERQPTDTAYFLSCRDSRYQSIIEYVTIKQTSDLTEIKNLLLKSIEVIKTEEVGTTVLFNGQSIYLSKLMGYRYVNINGETKGYTSLSEPQIKKLLTRIEDYER